MGYTKLFSTLVASTIWREDDKTRIVWITMLALRNARHEVEASVPGLADLARVSIEDCVKAIEKFKGPDPWSRNKGHEGRRIEEVQGGWRILNGEYYRKLMSEEDKRKYQREYHRDYRRKKREVAGENEEREKRFVKAHEEGDEEAMDRIAGEGL